MTIAVDLGHKATKQTNKTNKQNKQTKQTNKTNKQNKQTSLQGLKLDKVSVSEQQCSAKAAFLSHLTNEPVHEISNNVVYVTSKGSDQAAHMRSHIRAFACRLNIFFEC